MPYADRVEGLGAGGPGSPVVPSFATGLYIFDNGTGIWVPAVSAGADAATPANVPLVAAGIVNGSNGGIDRWHGIGTTPGSSDGIGKISQSRLTTFGGVFRTTAAGNKYLSHAYPAVAGTRYQYATIWHVGATAVKNVRLKKVSVWIISVSTTNNLTIDLTRIRFVAPVTGNPAITPLAANPLFSNSEAQLLALPTTQSTEVGFPFTTAIYSLGITGAAPVTLPPPPIVEVQLWPPIAGNVEIDDPLMRAGFDEGWAVVIESGSAIASTVLAEVQMVFTEEDS